MSQCKDMKGWLGMISREEEVGRRSIENRQLDKHEVVVAYRGHDLR